jgi:hypothetical protein
MEDFIKSIIKRKNKNKNIIYHFTTDNNKMKITYGYLYFVISKNNKLKIIKYKIFEDPFCDYHFSYDNKFHMGWKITDLKNLKSILNDEFINFINEYCLDNSKSINFDDVPDFIDKDDSEFESCIINKHVIIRKYGCDFYHFFFDYTKDTQNPYLNLVLHKDNKYLFHNNNNTFTFFDDYNCTKFLITDIDKYKEPSEMLFEKIRKVNLNKNNKNS